MTDDSSKRELAAYGSLVAFANNGMLDEDELAFLERLAMRDGVVDDAEKQVLRGLFERADRRGVSEAAAAEIAAFRERHGI